MALLPNPLIAPLTLTEIYYASGLFLPLSSEPSGADSPPTRSKRSHGSSTDEPSLPGEDGFVEDDLRAGGPVLAEAPCQTVQYVTSDWQYHPVFKNIDQRDLTIDLFEICRQNGVRPLEIHLCYRRAVFGPDATIPTALVLADRGDDVLARGWIDVARKLYAHLQTKGIDGVAVEIVDLRLLQRSRVFPCFPDDEIFPLWDTVGPAILEKIGLAGVFTVGCFRFGLDKDPNKCPPTVLIGVDHRHPRDWKQARDEVLGVLESHRLTTVGVLIRKDIDAFVGAISDANPAADPLIPGVAHCANGAKPAYSCAHHALKHGHGSLGEWVEIQNPDSKKWLPFALTCFHCCLPPEDALSAGDVKIVEKWTSDGVPVGDSNVERLLLVDSPTHADIHRGIDHLERQLNETQNEHRYQKVEKARITGDFVLPGDKRVWRIHTESIEILKNELGVMKNFFTQKRYHLGHVFSASGLREVQSTEDAKKGSNRDWALIRPNKERPVGINEISSQPAFQQGQLISFHGTLAAGQVLYKMGRATGFTVGKYGGLKSAAVARRIVGGEEREVATWEHCFTSPGKYIINKGDSGSFVFTTTGYVVGMLFGGANSGDIGYFTCTRDLLDDIRLITGAKQVRILGDLNDEG
ncbi:hypothetical protein BDW62DRAFT_24456 [Aspergillus aurantiobrunneus]